MRRGGDVLTEHQVGDGDLTQATAGVCPHRDALAVIDVAVAGGQRPDADHITGARLVKLAEYLRQRREAAVSIHR